MDKNKKSPLEGVDADFGCDDKDIEHILQHFKGYENEVDCDIGFAFIRNTEFIQKLIFQRFMLPEAVQKERKKFRIIVDYDPDYPFVLVKQVTDNTKVQQMYNL